jgi:hypothetical protein
MHDGCIKQQGQDPCCITDLRSMYCTSLLSWKEMTAAALPGGATGTTTQASRYRCARLTASCLLLLALLLLLGAAAFPRTRYSTRSAPLKEAGVGEALLDPMGGKEPGVNPSREGRSRARLSRCGVCA